MSLKTVAELQTLDYVFAGQPFLAMSTKSTIVLEGMDYAFLGQPLGWGPYVAAGGGSGNRPQMFTAM